MTGRPTAVDLFSGCGGGSIGLVRAGFELVGAIDLDRDAAQSYESILGLAPVVDDIRAVSAADITSESEVTLLLGCPPCQSFSDLRRGLERTAQDRIRDRLPDEYIRLVADLNPDYVAFENVPGFARGPALRWLLQSLRRIGYRLDWGVVNAADYGVPQYRRRLIVLGGRRRAARLPAASHGAGTGRRHITVREAIASLPRLASGEASEHDPMHRARRHTPTVLERLRHIPVGGSRHDIPEELRPQCHRGHTGHNDAYGRMRWDRPAPTLTSGCTNLTRGRFAHPQQDRAITAREALALQGFPDEVVLVGAAGSVARQIGNAVPPQLTAALGRAILEGA